MLYFNNKVTRCKTGLSVRGSRGRDGPLLIGGPGGSMLGFRSLLERGFSVARLGYSS